MDSGYRFSISVWVLGYLLVSGPQKNIYVNERKEGGNEVGNARNLQDWVYTCTD